MKLANQLLWVVLIATAFMWSGRVSAQDRDYGNRDRRSGACFFKDADFRGESFCADAGQRVSQVPEGFRDRISSVRIFGRTEVTVYQDRNFGGPSLRLRDDVANLQSYQVSPGHSWNDRISSIDGGACFYKEANFQGERFCVDKGERVYNVPTGFGDRISSVRIFGRTEVTLYQDTNFGGHNLRLRNDVNNLQSYQVAPGHSWNDRVSSIKVY